MGYKSIFLTGMEGFKYMRFVLVWKALIRAPQTGDLRHLRIKDAKILLRFSDNLFSKDQLQ